MPRRSPDLVVYGRDGQSERGCYHPLPALLLNELQRQRRALAEQTETISGPRETLGSLQAHVAQLEHLLLRRAGR